MRDGEGRRGDNKTRAVCRKRSRPLRGLVRSRSSLGGSGTQCGCISRLPSFPSPGFHKSDVSVQPAAGRRSAALSRCSWTWSTCCQLSSRFSRSPSLALTLAPVFVCLARSPIDHRARGSIKVRQRASIWANHRGQCIHRRVRTPYRAHVGTQGHLSLLHTLLKFRNVFEARYLPAHKKTPQ